MVFVYKSTTFGVQVPPAARADMEVFKERSLYPHIHARQAEDYQACSYLLAYPVTPYLLTYHLSYLRCTFSHKLP